jgi:hypothetical protein
MHAKMHAKRISVEWALGCSGDWRHWQPSKQLAAKELLTTLAAPEYNRALT